MRFFSPAHIVLLQKSWQAISGFITALLVTYFLTPEDQGYYYAIGSLLSGYILLDLGLSGLLVQISARMFPGLEMLPGGRVVPQGATQSAFQAMVGWSTRWYAKTSAIALLLIPIGFLYFSYARPGLQDSRWQLPWIVIVISVAISMPVYPAQSIIEGVGHISEVYLVRLAHYGLGALLGWALLASGAGLYAPAMAPFAVAVVSFWWLYSRYRELFAWGTADTDSFSWRDSVWPLQRKVAVSWLASYLFLNSPTLVVFYYGDASSAGQLGLSIVVANILGSLCASWLIAKVPHMTHLVAQDRHDDSHEMFLGEFKKAFLLMVAGYGSATLAVGVIGGTFVARRILPPFELALLFAVFLVFHSVGMLSVYFRARGKELLAKPAIAAIAIGLVASVAVVRDYGVLGVLVALLGAYSLIAVPGMYFAWTSSYDD